MLRDVAEPRETSTGTPSSPPAGAVPFYRTVLIFTCLLLGTPMTVFGVFVVWQGLGWRALAIVGGGVNLLLMALLVRMQPVKP